jgi:hypothetical protein
MTIDDIAAARRAGSREWAGLAALVLPALLVAMDTSVLNVAVPVLSRQLRPSSAELLWIVDIYGFMVAGFLIMMNARRSHRSAPVADVWSYRFRRRLGARCIFSEPGHAHRRPCGPWHRGRDAGPMPPGPAVRSKVTGPPTLRNACGIRRGKKTKLRGPASNTSLPQRTVTGESRCARS